MKQKFDLDDCRVAGIDVGNRYIVTLVNNFGAEPLAVPGGEFRRYLALANKRYSLIQREYDLRNIEDGAKKRKLEDEVYKKKFHLIHTISSQVVKKLIEWKVSKLAIGWNSGIKQRMAVDRRMSKEKRKEFQSISHKKLVDAIKYKAERAGIVVKVVDESYTTKCSYFDDEELCEHKNFNGKVFGKSGRLFKTGTGKIVHRDVNAAYNIMRKAFSFTSVNENRGALSHPRRWSIARVFIPHGIHEIGERIPVETNLIKKLGGD